MMDIIDIGSARYIAPGNSAIMLSVRFEGEDGYSPFVARPTDQYGVGAELFQRAMAGEFGPIEPYTRPAPEPEPVPATVSRAQGKAALIQAGHWQRVLDYANSIADPTEKALAQVALNDTTEWQRSSPFLNAAAAHLGLTQAQLDDLFRTASAIQL